MLPIVWRNVWGQLLYLAFLALLSIACYKHPVADDFDRYIYEALVRGKHDSPEVVYPAIKHSSRRAEQSSVLDSPAHLGQLEPLYAIRPLYIRAIEAAGFLPIQARINLISALSLFGIGIIVLAWTSKPGYSALLLATPAILILGRMGTPDALSALVVLTALWIITKDHLLLGMLLLLISIWIRTDNMILVMVVLGYLLWVKRLGFVDVGFISVIGAGSVVFINHFSGNYGWRVLFRYSFIGGKSPAEVNPHFSIAEYVGVVARNAQTIIPQMAIWILLGIVAWKLSSPTRGWLIPVWGAVVVHFALYPSPESRYLVWAFIITGVIFVHAIKQQTEVESIAKNPAFSR